MCNTSSGTSGDKCKTSSASFIIYCHMSQENSTSSNISCHRNITCALSGPQNDVEWINYLVTTSQIIPKPTTLDTEMAKTAGAS